MQIIRWLASPGMAPALQGRRAVFQPPAGGHPCRSRVDFAVSVDNQRPVRFDRHTAKNTRPYLREAQSSAIHKFRQQAQHHWARDLPHANEFEHTIIGTSMGRNNKSSTSRAPLHNTNISMASSQSPVSARTFMCRVS